MTTSPHVTTRWTGRDHAGIWNDPANWTGGIPVAGAIAQFMGVFISLDLAAAGGQAPIAGRISVNGGSVRFTHGTLHFANPPVDARFFSAVGLRVDGGGIVTIATGAALLGAHTVTLGDSSSGTLDVRGTLSDAQVYAGRGCAVSVLVAGSAAHWATTGIDQSFQFGDNVYCSMVIRDGGRVDDGPAWANPNASSTMIIGGVSAGASVLVRDPGSLLRFQIIDVGGSYNGVLTIADGAHVQDYGGNVGEFGDGTVNVTGAGSLWSNRNGLFVDGTAPHGSVSVTDRGALSFGSYGLQIGGAVSLDATATLTGGVIVMSGGSLAGLATPGQAHSTVTVAQSIELGYNISLGGSNVGNFVGSAAGATLVLAGIVTPQFSQYDPLAVGGGHVVLANGGNGDFATALYGGVLEISKAGASGSGGISFLDSSGATLQIDQPGAFANPIAGFGVSAREIIDLRAVAFSTPVALAWQQTDAGAGTLDVAGGASSASLVLDGTYAQSHFAAASDGHGGTAITYHL